MGIRDILKKLIDVNDRVAENIREKPLYKNMFGTHSAPKRKYTITEEDVFQERIIDLILKQRNVEAYEMLESRYRDEEKATEMFKRLRQEATERVTSKQGPYQEFGYQRDEEGNVRSVPTSEVKEHEPLMRRMRGAVIKDVYAWIPAVIGIIIFVWLGTFTNNLILSGGVLFSLSLAFSKSGGAGAFKAIIKFVGIVLLSLGFLSIYPFAGLIALFLGYISMPVKVRVKEEEQTYNNAVGFSRMFLGLALAVFIFYVLGGDNALKTPMFLIALGFFFAIPEASEEIPKGTGVNIFNYMKRGGSDTFAFVSGILILAGVFFGMLNLTWGSATWIIFVSVGLVGALTAFRSHAAERGAMGAPLVALLLITLSTSYPALLGESIFGAWWPSVESSLTTITGPLGDAFSQMQGGFGSAFSMVTNPSGYYEQEMARQQTTANIKSGGTTKSIDVSEFSFQINNVPEQPLVASAILENKGEFKATNIKAVLNPLMLKASTSGKGSYTQHPEIPYSFTTCSGVTPEDEGAAKAAKCVWKDPSYNGDMKLMTFTYGTGEANWGDLGKCICSKSKGVYKGDCPEGVDGCRTCSSLTNTPPLGSTTCDKTSGDVISYEYAGSSMQVGFNYSFDYIVNVSLDMQLMQGKTMEDLLMKKQIRLQDVEAQYSGGPVRASIWTQKQPVRMSEDTLAVITITNQGTGTVKKGATYVLSIPLVSGMQKEKLTINEVSKGGLNCKLPADFKTDHYEMSCTLDKDLQKGLYAKYAFIFKYDIPAEVDKKTILFVGNVNYKYETQQMQNLIATWIPPQ